MLMICTIAFGQFSQDFETTTWTSNVRGGTAAQVTAATVANPTKTGINTSDNALQLILTDTAPSWRWAFISNPGGTYGAADGTYIKFKFMSVDETNVSIQLEPWFNSVQHQTSTIDFTGVALNTWYEVEFDLSTAVKVSDGTTLAGAEPGYLSRLDIKFNASGAYSDSTHDGEIFYMDDVRQSDHSGTQYVPFTGSTEATVTHSSMPVEIAAGNGNNAGKGLIKTIVSWSNVTVDDPTPTKMFNQLYDATGTQVGGYSFDVTTSSGSQELLWGYFGGGELIAGTNASINSSYKGTVSLTENIPIVSTITRWTAGTDTDWDTPGNWTNGVPTASSKVAIPNLFNDPIASGAISAAEITLQEEASLAVGGAITNSGDITLFSGASLTAASVSGNVIYNRSLSVPDYTTDRSADNLNGWYLVSSPVSGEAYDASWITNNSIAYSGSSNRAIATYSQASSGWSYTSGGGTGSFGDGLGYSIKKNITGDMTFSGSFRGSNITDVNLVVDGSNGYNLLGNPFTAYLSLSDLMTANSGLLESSTIWLWDSANKTYNATTGSYQIAPGQAFFVEASAAASTFTFNTSMASVQTADTFLKSSSTVITLNITDGNLKRYAKINYLDNASKSFDNGFDAKLFGGVAQPFAIYSQLIQNDEGKKYQIQALPSSDLETMVVPVGINAIAGKEITIDANITNLPSGLKVYLEDRENNTFVDLSEGNQFKTTLTADLNGIGRFYLHTKASNVLSTEGIELNDISIYKTNQSTLRITGLSQGKSSLRLYTILGKQVINTTFVSDGVSDINLPSLATGIYVVQLSTEKGTLNKKITLE